MYSSLCTHTHTNTHQLSRTLTDFLIISKFKLVSRVLLTTTTIVFCLWPPCVAAGVVSSDQVKVSYTSRSDIQPCWSHGQNLHNVVVLVSLSPYVWVPHPIFPVLESYKTIAIHVVKTLWACFCLYLLFPCT